MASKRQSQDWTTEPGLLDSERKKERSACKDRQRRDSSGTHSCVLKQLRSYPVEKGRDFICIALEGRTSVAWKKVPGGGFHSIQDVRAWWEENCPRREHPAERGDHDNQRTPSHPTGLSTVSFGEACSRCEQS